MAQVFQVAVGFLQSTVRVGYVGEAVAYPLFVVELARQLARFARVSDGGGVVLVNQVDIRDGRVDLVFQGEVLGLLDQVFGAFEQQDGSSGVATVKKNVSRLCSSMLLRVALGRRSARSRR